MTRIYEFLIALGIVAVLALVIGLVLPSHRHISESVETNRKMTIVYDTVNNLRRFKDWNPLVLRDPQMQLNVTGPEAGVGARLDYVSNEGRIGKGSWEIVDSVPNEKVVIKVEDFQDDAFRPAKGEKTEAEGLVSGFNGQLPGDFFVAGTPVRTTDSTRFEGGIADDLADNVNMHATFVAAGPGIRKQAPVAGVRAVDLAPTVSYLLGVPGTANARGRRITTSSRTSPSFKWSEGFSPPASIEVKSPLNTCGRCVALSSGGEAKTI